MPLVDMLFLVLAIFGMIVAVILYKNKRFYNVFQNVLFGLGAIYRIVYIVFSHGGRNVRKFWGFVLLNVGCKLLHRKEKN